MVGMITNNRQTVDKSTYRPLDLNRLKGKNSQVISTKNALSDVIPIKWDEEVINGHKNVLLKDKN